MRPATVVAATFTLLALAPLTPADTLTQYAAPGGSFAATTVSPVATASELNDTGSSADLQAGFTFADTVFLNPLIASPTPASAVTNNQFFQFTLAPAAGRTLNLATLTFDATRGGASTPRGWVLRSSRDNFTANLGTGEVTTQNPTLSPFSVSLGSSTFQNLSSPTTFRLYDYAPSSGNGLFYDNITVSGTAGELPALVRYAAPGGSFLPTTLANHTLASNLNANGSAANLEAGSALADTIFLNPLLTSPTPAAAVANKQYFQFTVSPEPGYQFDLSALLFDATRGGASTPRGWVLRTSRDNFASDVATGQVPTQNPTLTPASADLTGPAFRHITSPTTFRLYDYSPSSGNGLFYDNIALIGTPRPILLGDTNDDAVVDLADLNNVLNNFGSNTPFNIGDNDQDGHVDLADLNNVLNHFGAHAAPASLSLPEPSLPLLTSAFCLLTSLPHRRRLTTLP